MPDPSEPQDPSERVVSRRALFTGLFSSVRRAIPAEQEAEPQPEPEQQPEPPVPLPAPDTIRDDLQTMHGLGPRFPGSPAHEQHLAWIQREMLREGCSLLSTRSHADSLWIAQSWGLKAGSEEIRVATARARSAGTGSHPRTGPLVYLGAAPAPRTEGRDLVTARAEYQAAMREWFERELAAHGPRIEGAVLVVDLGGPPDFTQGYMGALAGCYYTQTPSHLTWPLWNQGRRYRKAWMLPDPGDAVPTTERPAGIVYIVDACFDELADQFLPATGAPTPIPTLLLDRDAGAQVRAAAQRGETAELSQDATTQDVDARDLVFALPGVAGGGYVLVNAFTDGVSAAANGGVALVNIARHLAALKRSGKGLRRTVVFGALSGSLASTASKAPKARGLLENHDPIARSTALAINVENLGCTEWVETERGFEPTGIPEPAMLFHDQRLTALVYDRYIGTQLFNHGVSRGGGEYFGLGRGTEASIPTVSLIAGPTYLHQPGGLDRIDPALFARQLEVLIAVLTGSDVLPAPS